MSPRVAALALLLTAAVGCTSSTSSSSSSPSPSSPSAAPMTPLPTATSAPAASPSPSGFAPVLVLEPDGLGVLVGPASIRHFPFASTSATDIKAVLTRVLGAGSTSGLPSCGQGPRTAFQVQHFQVLLSGTSFVGWTDQGSPGRTLSSANGIEVGMTLAALKDAETITLSTESLGPEFAGSLSGLLSGTKADSVVTALYAGETCVFR